MNIQDVGDILLEPWFRATLFVARTLRHKLGCKSDNMPWLQRLHFTFFFKKDILYIYQIDRESIADVVEWLVRRTDSLMSRVRTLTCFLFWYHDVQSTFFDCTLNLVLWKAEYIKHESTSPQAGSTSGSSGEQQRSCGRAKRDDTNMATSGSWLTIRDITIFSPQSACQPQETEPWSACHRRPGLLSRRGFFDEEAWCDLLIIRRFE
jgi:hypothetical protein